MPARPASPHCRHPVGGETWEDVELCERFVLGSISNRESFSPSGFLLGEKVPKADEGAFHACVIRARADSPHFSHAVWNCRRPVGGQTEGDVALCERFVLVSTSNREPFSPRGFLRGEKVPKADEGAFHEDVIRAPSMPSSALGPASVNRAYLVKRPPALKIGFGVGGSKVHDDCTFKNERPNEHRAPLGMTLGSGVKSVSVYAVSGVRETAKPRFWNCLTRYSFLRLSS